jgi:2-polyprenyl-3-methyl-5-hydroxy-6-metoxy-1,4-benzoquinol methylase
MRLNKSQTCADKSFDLVITQDVMEHVYHPDRVFYEIARTLLNKKYESISEKNLAIYTSAAKNTSAIW